MKGRNLNSQNNNLILGLLILCVGLVLLLKKMGIFFPGWVFSWPMVFIALGLIILVKHRFQSGFGFLMLLFGSFFLIKREFDLPIEIGQYLIPVGLILLGLYLILYRRNNNYNHWMVRDARRKSPTRDPFNGGSPKNKSSTGIDPGTFYNDGGEILNSQALFCGVQKRVLSKSFQGGKISSIFGGTEIDLRQADLAEEAFLDVEVAFGGIKLIVPPHWDLQMNVSNVFSGIEDKRIYLHTTPDPSKILRIKGSVIFGGLEIKSF